jgi:hypothetical protein
MLFKPYSKHLSIGLLQKLNIAVARAHRIITIIVVIVFDVSASYNVDPRLRLFWACPYGCGRSQAKMHQQKIHHCCFSRPHSYSSTISAQENEDRAGSMLHSAANNSKAKEQKSCCHIILQWRVAYLARNGRKRIL